MTKKNLNLKVKSILLIAVLICSFAGINVSAGANVTVTDILTQTGEFNSSDWFVPNDDLIFKDNSLNFNEEGNEETRLITKTIANKDDSFENLVKVDARVIISNIPQGQSFILAAGLSSIDALYSEEGNLEIHIKNDSGLSVNVVAFKEAGKPTAVTSGVKYGAPLNSVADISFVISNRGILKVSVNGRNLITASLPFIPEGRIGLLQTDKCNVSVSKLTMTSYSYDRPENANVKEDFESGYIDANAFTSKKITNPRVPSGIQVEEYNGSKVLMFRNAGIGYFGTTYSYSNFEISFDVPYILREYIYDDEGNQMQIPSGEYGVSFGDIAADVSGQDYQQSTDLILFTGSAANGWFSGWKAPFDEKSFYKPETNEGYSVKITVVDGNLTLYMKGLKDTAWQEMAKHSYSNNKVGPIKIWSTRDTNIAFDNISVSNLDSDANLIENKYRSGKIEQADYVYSPQKNVFRESEKTEKSFNWSFIIVYSAIGAAVICISGIVGGYCIKRHSEKKRKMPDAKK